MENEANVKVDYCKGMVNRPQRSKRLIAMLVVALLVLLAGSIAAGARFALGWWKQTTATKQKRTSPFQVCPDDDTETEVRLTSSRQACESMWTVAPGCIKRTSAEQWRLFFSYEKEWQSIVDLVTANGAIPLASCDQRSTLLVVSPTYTTDRSTSELTINLRFASRCQYQVYLVGSGEAAGRKRVARLLRQGESRVGCNSLRSSVDVSAFRVVVVASSSESGAVDGAHAQFRPRPLFASIAAGQRHGATATRDPEFATVSAQSCDLCSLEAAAADTRRVDCAWSHVLAAGDSSFRRVRDTDCVHGRRWSLRARRRDQWYLELAARPGVDTKAMIVSPRVRRKAADAMLRLAFWYMTRCGHVRAYVVRDHADVRAASVAHQVVNVSESTHDWHLSVVDVPLPPDYDIFHVSIAATVSPRCDARQCNSRVTLRPTSRHFPALAINEISLQLLADKCATGGSAKVNCSFQTNAKENTYCSWRSTAPGTQYRSHNHDMQFMNEWAIESINDDYRSIPDQHFEGRGSVASWRPSNPDRFMSGYLRSPLLVANSNCSCQMQMLYLFRGDTRVRIEVNLHVTENHNVMGDVFPQWSIESGEGTESWQQASVRLNLMTSRPFQVEIRATGNGRVHLDDVGFLQCGKGMKSFHPAWSILPEATQVFTKLDKLQSPEQIDDVNWQILEQFFVVLYSSTCNTRHVEEARRKLFTSGSPLQNIPNKYVDFSPNAEFKICRLFTECVSFCPFAVCIPVAIYFLLSGCILHISKHYPLMSAIRIGNMVY